MKKKLLASVIAGAMLLSMSMPVFAANSDSTGSASGVTTLSGEVEYTTAYTLVIPANISNMDLSQDAETTVGEVSVTKQNDNAEFDPSKRVSVTVEYDGELVNEKDSSQKIAYKLQQKEGDTATDIASGGVLAFSAAEIESGDVARSLSAVVTTANKTAGTYSGNINFSAAIENATVTFTAGCGERNSSTIHEVNAGTTWGEYLASANNDSGYEVDENDQNVLCRCGDYWVKDLSTAATNIEVDDVIKSGGLYGCSYYN